MSKHLHLLVISRRDHPAGFSILGLRSEGRIEDRSRVVGSE
jgi:hypothetical protein